MIRYTITEEEYLEMSAFALKKRRGAPAAGVLKLLLKTVVQMGAAAFLIFHYRESVAPWMKWTLGILSVLWAALSLFQYFFVDLRAKMLLAEAKRGVQSADFWKEHRLEMTKEGLRLSFGNAKLEIPHDEISEVAETDALYLVFRGRDVFELVPKRAAEGFREELLAARAAAKKEQAEELQRSILQDAAFAKRLSISREELGAELARVKRRSLGYACGWSGMMIFTVAFPLVLAMYSASAGSWANFGLCMLAFFLFNFQLLFVFLPSYGKYIAGKFPDPGEEGYLLAVKDRNVYFLAGENWSAYSLDKLKKKVTDADGLFLYFEKQNMLFVPREVADAFEVAAGFRKSIRERAAVPVAAQAEEEEEPAHKE